MEEEWESICMKAWTLDLGKIKKMVAKRCLTVIDRMCINNALQEK